MGIAGGQKRVLDVQLGTTHSDRHAFHRHRVFEMDVRENRDSKIGSAQEFMPVTVAPASAKDVHNINLLLGAIVIGAQANVQWLKPSQPNLEAAQRTSARLLAQIQNLCEMVDGLRSGPT
jgi:hypothetical protein